MSQFDPFLCKAEGLALQELGQISNLHAFACIVKMDKADKATSIAHLVEKARRLSVPRDFKHANERARGEWHSGKDLGTVHPLEYTHKQKLRSLLLSFVLEHKWSEAAGVLSVLLRTITPKDDLREDRTKFYFWSAMEVLKKLEAPTDNMPRIRRLFNLLLAHSNKRRRSKRGRGEVELEVALHLANEGDLDGALHISRPVIDVPPFRDDPAAQLFHGLILHKMWYKKAEEEINSERIYYQASSQNKMGNLMEGTDETMRDNVDDWDLFDEHHSLSQGSSFESSRLSNSVCDDASAFMLDGEKSGKPDERFAERLRFSPKDSNEDKQYGVEEENKDFLEGAIIFSSPELSEVLFPVRLPQNRNNLPYLVPMKSAVQDIYNRAVKHLQIALAGARDVPLALLPLVQLLLAGGDVKGAYFEIEECCKASIGILPLRIKALFLESLAQKHRGKLSHCYREIVYKCPSSEDAVQSILDLHSAGACDIIPFVETISQHLDVSEGATLVWHRLSACFLSVKVQYGKSDRKRKRERLPHLESEAVDENASLGQSGQKRLESLHECLCKIFVDRKDRWSAKHFTVNNFVLLQETDNKRRIGYKAACAIHLYGPESSFVKAAVNFLEAERRDDLLALLQLHSQQALLL